MITAGRGAMLLCLLLTSGCAGGSSAEAGEEELPAAAAVRAFANICGRLDAPEVMQRAGNLGFMAVDPARAAALVSANLPRDGSLQFMVRPPTVPGAISAVLAWNARGPSCELALAGVTPAAVERAFDRMVETLSRQGGLQVLPGQIDPNAPTDAAGLKLRRAALMISPQLLGGAPQAVMLRTADAAGDDNRVRAILSLHVARPQPGGGATPPPVAAPQRP